MRTPSKGPRRPDPEPAPAGALRVVAIVGPTASGKSSLAVELAAHIGGEIVSADSQQVYRCFDIGTAKPRPEELARVRHHLISSVEPGGEMNAAAFASAAHAAIEDVVRRGRRPLVVGGTGLYVRALLFGIAPVPAAGPDIRLRLASELDERGAAALHARLAAIDPTAAAETPPGNRVRLLRALEIHALTGEPPSTVRRRHGFRKFRYRALALGVSPPRAELYARIDERTRAMFASGLVDEVRALCEAGFEGAQPMRSLGYRHALAHVRGEADLKAAIDRACGDTRRYAKRQLTWFRSEPWVEWVDWPPDATALAARIETFFAA